MANLPLIPFPGYIKIAITTPIVLYVRSSVYTRTKYVLILFTVSGSQPAWAGHITVTFFIYNQGLKEIKNPVFVFVEKIPFWFLNLF
jgi:hypothetical protein